MKFSLQMICGMVNDVLDNVVNVHEWQFEVDCWRVQCNHLASTAEDSSSMYHSLRDSFHGFSSNQTREEHFGSTACIHAQHCSQVELVCHRLTVNHAMKMLLPFVQESVPHLLLCLIPLRLDVEVECFHAFKCSRAEHSAWTSGMVDHLQ